MKNEALRELRVELSKKHKARELDGFGLYLQVSACLSSVFMCIRVDTQSFMILINLITFLYRYGVVLRKLDLVKEAIDVFVEAAHVLPLHWGAWLELCNLITDKEMVKYGRYQNVVTNSRV